VHAPLAFGFRPNFEDTRFPPIEDLIVVLGAPSGVITEFIDVASLELARGAEALTHLDALDEKLLGAGEPAKRLKS
jgi:hypothetical protein